MASMLEQKDEGGSRLAVRYALPVIDDERDGVVVLVDLVDQGRQHVAAGVIAVFLEHLSQ